MILSRCRLFAVGALSLLAALLLASACASSSEVITPDIVAAADPTANTFEATPVPTPTVPTAAVAAPATTLAAVADVAPELAGLGELIVLHSEPVRQMFDVGGGTLVLADGATVQVPTQSFSEPTEVTVVISDLLFGKYLQDAPQSRIYRLSTVEDVDLLRPLVLEVPRLAETVSVKHLIDGVWTDVTVPDLPTTRIEVTHFSAQNYAVTNKADCRQPINAELPDCLNDPLWGDYYIVDDGRAIGDNLVAIEAGACKSLCPTRTAPGTAPAAASSASTQTDPSTPTPTPESAPVESSGSGPSTTPPATPTATPPATPTATPTSGSQVSCRPGYTSTNGKCLSSQNCEQPRVGLDRNGQVGCVTEAVCISTGSGWSANNGTCVGPPPCEGESQDHYKRDSSGTCRTPRFGCAHPQLDYPHIPGCTSRADCAPASAGYSIVGSTCVFDEIACDSGYVWDGSHCVSFNHACVHPFVEFIGVGQPAQCVSRSQCVSFGTGWSHAEGRCIEPTFSCQPGYVSGFGAAAGSCITPNLECSHPSVEFVGVGQRQCMTHGECTAIGSGWSVSDGTCREPA